MKCGTVGNVKLRLHLFLPPGFHTKPAQFLGQNSFICLIPAAVVALGGSPWLLSTLLPLLQLLSGAKLQAESQIPTSPHPKSDVYSLN